VDRAAPFPHREALEAIAGSVFEGGVERAWTSSGGTFVLTRRTRPGVDLASVAPYPPAASEAAIGGRVVTVAEVWTVREGALARVMSRPVRLRPMVCEADLGCDIVDVKVEVTPSGAIEARSESCHAATSRLSVKPAEGETPFDRYDRAVIPAICTGEGFYRWSGRTFASTSRGNATAGEPVTFLEPEEGMARLLHDLAPTSLTSSPVKTWASPSGDALRVLFLHTHAAPSHSFFSHAPAARDWESGRALQVAEVWVARAGSFHRALSVPVGLGALAGSLSVLSLTVEVNGDEVSIGGSDRTPCVASSAQTPDAPRSEIEMKMVKRDQEATDRICASRGRYREVGRAFVRAPDDAKPARGSSF
jgi:hypothetical protein